MYYFFQKRPTSTFRSLARPRYVLRISSLHFWNLLMILLRFKKSLWKTIKHFWSKIDFKFLIKKFENFRKIEKFSIFQIFRFFENFQWKCWFFRFFDFSKNFENFKFSMKIQWHFWFFKNFEIFWSTFWNRFSIRKCWWFSINFF